MNGTSGVVPDPGWCLLLGSKTSYAVFVACMLGVCAEGCRASAMLQNLLRRAHLPALRTVLTGRKGRSHATNPESLFLLGFVTVYPAGVRERVLPRYWLGVTPTKRENERRITSALPNPQATAICSRPRSVRSNCWRTASTRTCKTYWDGVLPTSRVNTRSKFRTLMAARSATACTDSFFR